MTHPDHVDRVHQIGTLAGFPVYNLTLDSADRPWLRRSLLHVNGTTTWIRIGKAPWVYQDRGSRVRQWLDPEGSPWAISDLEAILLTCEIPDPEKEDWIDPVPETGWDTDYHWNVRLPAARKRAVERYINLILST